jgi:hypothetical protein
MVQIWHFHLFNSIFLSPRLKWCLFLRQHHVFEIFLFQINVFDILNRFNVMM